MSISNGSVTIEAGQDAFSVMTIDVERPRRVALFAAGRGGNPSRHGSLLEALARAGCMIVAPRFDMLGSTVPTKVELDQSVRRLDAALDRIASRNLPVAGIGHSIGSATLLALQGAQGETSDGRHVIVGSGPRLSHLALMAPPTGFFRRPGALNNVHVSTRIWVGAEDTITPPSQSFFLKDALSAHTFATVVVEPEAGHFTFMDDLPPNASDPHPDRTSFLARLAKEITGFFDE